MSVETAAVQGIGMFSLMLVIIANKMYSIFEKLPNHANEGEKAGYFLFFWGFTGMAVLSGTFNLWFVNSLLYANNVATSLASPLNMMNNFLMVMIGLELFIGIVGLFLLLYKNGGDAWIWLKKSVDTFGL